jgi:hypothetical protein
MTSPEVLKKCVNNQGFTLSNERGRKKKKDSIPKRSKTENDIQGMCITRLA